PLRLADFLGHGSSAPAGSIVVSRLQESRVMSDQTHTEPRAQRPARRPAPAGDSPPRPNTPAAEEGFLGYDEEVNSRYEEIKRGGTYITELQQMTMAQLQKLAKDEEIPREEWVGLKKQDLIFKILKERVKQNGLMYGEGTLEILPDGFGFLRSP